MGETGSGKSTFINYLANFFSHGSLSSLKVLIPSRFHTESIESTERACHSEANPTDVTASQTQECRTYSFRGEKVNYKAIDTPGFSDTSSSANHCVDDDVTKKILSAVSNTKSLQAIVVIINGTHPRLTDSARNALERITGNYPATFSKNMLVVFTSCTAATKNFDESTLPFKPKRIFVMNNSAFSFQTKQMQEWEESERQIQNFNWQQAMKQIQAFVLCLKDMSSKSTKVFRQMLDSRSELTLQVQRAIKEIKELQVLTEKKEQLQRDLSAIVATRKQEEEKVRSLERNIRESQTQEYSQTASRKQAESERDSMQAKGFEADARLRTILAQKLDTHLREENRLRLLKEDLIRQKQAAEKSLLITRTQETPIEKQLDSIRDQIL